MMVVNGVQSGGGARACPQGGAPRAWPGRLRAMAGAAGAASSGDDYPICLSDRRGPGARLLQLLPAQPAGGSGGRQSSAHLPGALPGLTDASLPGAARVPGVLGARVGAGVFHARVVRVSAVQASAVYFGEEAPLGTWFGVGGSEAVWPHGCVVVFLEPVRVHGLGTPMVSGQCLLPAAFLEVAGGVWTPRKAPASSSGGRTGLVVLGESLVGAVAWRPAGEVQVPPGLPLPGPSPATPRVWG